MPLSFISVLLLLKLASGDIGSSSPATLHGVITQVQGAVEVAGPGVSDFPLAAPWQVIQAGVNVRVPEGGAVGIVCSTRRFVRLLGPVSWSLVGPACSLGRELTPAEYSLIAPQGGRFKVVEGILVLEREMRSSDDDDSLAPVVLRPRSDVIRSQRPMVYWSRISSAIEYEIRWSGRGTRGHTLRLQAEAVACAEEREKTTICSIPWPEDRPGLQSGEIYFLQVAARSGIAEPWHSNDPVGVRTQTSPESEALESQLRNLERLGLQGAALVTAHAGLLAERGLYSDAAELFRQALIAQPAPELRITLADLDFAIGLHFLAETSYREALSEPKSSVRAAAAFGLGRIAYAKGNFRDAAAFFREAREQYSSLELVEEEVAARRAAEKATMRIPQ